MIMKKMFAAFAAAAVLASAVPAFAMPDLTSEQVTEAKIKGNHLVPEKKVSFAFAAWKDYHVKGNFLKDDIRTTADAYWLTPFCHVINEQMVQSRTGNRDFRAIPEAGTEYQLRVLIASRNLDKDALRAAVVTVKQGDHELTSLRIRYTNLQRAEETELVRRIMWHKVGIVIDFATDDVQENVPVEVTVTGNGDEPIVFPALANDMKYDSFDTKSHKFQWYPLHFDI